MDDEWSKCVFVMQCRRGEDTLWSCIMTWGVYIRMAISAAVLSEIESSSSKDLLLPYKRFNVNVLVATRASCSGLCVIQMHVFVFSVFSTRSVDSGSNADVGSANDDDATLTHGLVIVTHTHSPSLLPSSNKISGFKANATAKEARCISPPERLLHFSVKCDSDKFHCIPICAYTMK